MKKYLVVFSILLCTLSAVENKQFTIKGFYNLPGMINMDTTNSSFDGSLVKVTSESDISIDSGLGFGIEAIIAKIKDNIEIIGGGNWSFQRKGNDITREGETEYFGQTSDLPFVEEDAEDYTVDIKSIYAKVRYLFNPEETTSFYVAGKTAYNVVNISNDIEDSQKTDNGLGVGFSAGVIYDNNFDIELAIDNITGAAKQGVVLFDTYGNILASDTLKGDYSLINTSISIGLRF